MSISHRFACGHESLEQIAKLGIARLISGMVFVEMFNRIFQGTFFEKRHHVKRAIVERFASTQNGNDPRMAQPPHDFRFAQESVAALIKINAVVFREDFDRHLSAEILVVRLKNHAKATCRVRAQLGESRSDRNGSTRQFFFQLWCAGMFGGNRRQAYFRGPYRP